MISFAASSSLSAPSKRGLLPASENKPEPSQVLRGHVKQKRKQTYPPGPLGFGRTGPRCRLAVAAIKEGNVLDRPDVVTSPGEKERKDRQKQKPRLYKVMLHNDAVNRREYVVRVLLRVVKALTVDSAVNVMQLAHQYGLACVITCAQQDAERYCEGLRSNGLIATVEPAGTDSNGNDEPST